MTARLYAPVTSAKGTESLKGQAKVVWNELQADPRPRLGTDITCEIVRKGTLSTTQDPLRVVLYYLVIFKNKGIVSATDPASAPASVNPWRELAWSATE